MRAFTFKLQGQYSSTAVAAAAQQVSKILLFICSTYRFLHFHVSHSFPSCPHMFRELAILRPGLESTYLWPIWRYLEVYSTMHIKCVYNQYLYRACTNTACIRSSGTRTTKNSPRLCQRVPLVIECQDLNILGKILPLLPLESILLRLANNLWFKS